MLDVSDKYKSAIKALSRTDRMTGTIRLSDGTTIAITDELIINNSVILREQLVKGDVFQIGTFYTNELDIAIYDGDISRSYANAVITPFYELLLSDSTWEQIPLGTFTVDNSVSVRKGSKRMLKAFDSSIKFDVDIAGYLAVYPANNTVAGHIRNVCLFVGVPLATSDMSALPNSEVETDISKSSSVQTCRDVIEHGSALMGCSACITRDNRLEILQLVAKISDENEYIFDAVIGGDERRGTEFFDLRALIKYVHTTINGSAISYTTGYTLSSDELGRNAIVTVDTNPLLENLDATDEEKKEVFINSTVSFKNVLRQADFSFIGNPAIECFDTIAITGGQIDLNRMLAVFPTKSVWKYRNSHSISCASAELTDESTFISEAVMLADETEPIKTPSAVRKKTDKRIDGIQKDKKVDLGIILIEKAMQNVCHNYTEIGYISGNDIVYGDIANNIICNGYSLRSQAVDIVDAPKYKKMTFPKAYNISSLAFGSGGKIESASEVVIEAIVDTIFPSGQKQIKVNVLYTDDSDGVRYAYNYSSFQVSANEDYCVSPYWTGITAPTEERPYGAVKIYLQAYSGSEGNWESEYSSVGTDMYVPFQSEAEFNAAVGLTNTPLELLKLQDFQYLVPESQLIVDKALSEDSDNVIANSTVAKALSLKADKETVETLSLVVDSKADVVELDALSEDYNTAKADFDTRIKKLSSASANHGVILNEHADMLELKADKAEVQLISQQMEGKAELSELNFIGENILDNATFHSNFAKWHFTNNTFSEITIKDGFACAHFSGALTKSTSMRQSVLDEIDKENLDQLYTFSADIRLDDYVAGTTNPFVQLYFSATYDNNGTSTAFNATTVAGSPDLTQHSGQGWKRIYWTVRFTRVPDSIYAFVYARDFTGELYFRNLKLEKGSVPTAYTPSVMDYTELVDRVAVLEAAILSLGGEV